MTSGGDIDAELMDGPDELACDRLLDFAVRVGKVVDALPETRLARHVAGQACSLRHIAAAELRRGRRRREPKGLYPQARDQSQGAARNALLVIVDHEVGDVARPERLSIDLADERVHVSPMTTSWPVRFRIQIRVPLGARIGCVAKKGVPLLPIPTNADGRVRMFVSRSVLPFLFSIFYFRPR